ncbi:hypothetical protein [Clavibacter capsici]|uniref:hypothetical protein n=1 Tax=Clavibacter capsici TaxID=1874630 RepID=UPI0014283DBE|nr:hypothetical protein [Clavibacter capsici]QIS38659.1 hypothetical protein GW572_04605 [Clavibacter capsici]
MTAPVVYSVTREPMPLNIALLLTLGPDAVYKADMRRYANNRASGQLWSRLQEVRK